jgi:hypothetical protein
MAWGRWTILPVGLVFLGTFWAGTAARGSDTKARLLEEIQKAQNPVVKAKKEIKLSQLELSEVQDAYSQGHTEEGVKLLNKFADTLDDAWKNLQNSGRIASKQPGGFRELEISLREDARTLEDLERGVEYFNRGPIEDAAKKLDQTHNQVFQLLFPPEGTKTGKVPPSSPAATPGPAQTQ